MLRGFFSSKTRIRLLRLFIFNPHKPFYLREISKVLNEPLTPIRRELLNLAKVGFLQQAKVANLVYYQVNTDFLFFDELKRIIQKVDIIEKGKEAHTLVGVFEDAVSESVLVGTGTHGTGY